MMTLRDRIQKEYGTIQNFERQTGLAHRFVQQMIKQENVGNVTLKNAYRMAVALNISVEELYKKQPQYIINLKVKQRKASEE